MAKSSVESINLEYKRSKATELYNVYGRLSRAKAQAWENCKRICGEHNGYGLRVLGHNTSFFSAGFLYNDEETGEIYLVKITKGGLTVVPYEM